jgi:hypothetical protein
LTLDARAAGDYLTRQGLDDAHRAAVLGATHCAAPESYLILSSALVSKRGTWLDFGHWRPRRAGEPPRSFAGGAERSAAETFSSEWMPCQRSADGRERVCASARAEPLPSRHGMIAAVVYDENRPADARLVRARSRTEIEHVPVTVLVAEAAELRLAEPASREGALDETLAVLVDPAGARALVGTREMLRSTFVGLMYLDGRYQPHYRKIDDRTAAGERVVIWRIEWPTR